MNRILASLGIFLLLGHASAQPPGGVDSRGLGFSLDIGEVVPLTAFASGESPEGVAVIGPWVFVSNRRVEVIDGLPVRHNSIVRVSAASGKVQPFAQLPEDFLFPGSNGVLGLAFDGQRRLYAALHSNDQTTQGVYRISASGNTVERVPGSENMTFPNAITFDGDDRIYVTDSATGTIWRFTVESGVPMTPWAESPLFAPSPDDPLGIPLPGANGIAFVAPDKLFVANTEKGLLAGVTINSDGSAGEVRLVAADLFLASIDGIAADENGHIHGVIPGYHLIGVVVGDPSFVGYPLVKIDTATGILTPTAFDPTVSHFDFPLSLAFGTVAGTRTSVFVTNGDLPLSPTGPGAGVVEVGVGVAGAGSAP